jgi:excinuclease UvrABC ATPase subunit
MCLQCEGIGKTVQLDVDKFLVRSKSLNGGAIRQADWIIDLGREGGGAGGRVLFEGPPARLKECAESITGRFI